MASSLFKRALNVLKGKETCNYLTSTHFWSPVANWGNPFAAISGYANQGTSENTNTGGIKRADKYGSIPQFNYRNTIMHIRHRKIKKHHRLKWIKNNLSAIKYTRLRRNIDKEKAFRAEIFAAVKEAEDFSPEKYVDEVLDVIDKAPKPITKEDNLRNTINLIRKYRSDTELITPEFEDPVVPVHENAFRIK